jgi:hypothetical protein
MGNTVTASRLESGTPVRIWYGIAGAPAAWVTQSTLIWWVSSRGCVGTGAGAWVRVVVAVICAAAFVAGATALALSIRDWTAMKPAPALNRARGTETAEYLALAGVLVSAVFVLAIGWTALPALVFDLCERTR